MRTRAGRDGSDWVLNGTKMWITNGNLADVATVWAQTDDGIRGFLVPTDTPGFTANDIHNKLSLRASVTSELVLDNVRLPGSAQLPEARGLSRPAVLPQRGPLRHRVRARWARPATAWRPPSPTPTPASVRQAARRLPAHPGEARQHDRRARQGHAAGAAPRPHQGRRSSGPSRSASASSTTSARPSPSPASAAPCWAAAASPWSTRRCATPTTSNPS